MITVQKTTKNQYNLTLSKALQLCKNIMADYGILYNKDLKRLPIEFDIVFIRRQTANFRGQFHRKDYSNPRARVEINIYYLADKQDFLTTITHEIVHYIQSITDFDGIYTTPEHRNKVWEKQKIEQEAMVFSWLINGIEKSRYDLYKDTKDLYLTARDKISQAKKW